MPHGRELDYQTWLEDAEQAAAAGDLARAEALLREAARAQEDHLGPVHADLASTFNNLGIVCEQNGHLEDAEAFYRRALAIATAVAGPADPIVETAARNLRDFCEANGRPVEDWPGMNVAAADAPEPPPDAPPRAAPHQSAAGPAPPEAHGVNRPATAAPAPAAGAAPPRAEPWRPPASPAPPAVKAPPPPAPGAGTAPTAATHAPRAPSRPPVLFMVGVAAAALIATAVVAGLWQPWADDEPAARDTAAASGPEAAGPAAESSPRVAPPPAAEPEPPPAAATATAAPSGSPPPLDAPAPVSPTPTPPPTAPAPRPSAAPRASAAAPSDVRVVTASVCASLSPAAGWRCAPLEDATDGDSASYFTRIASPRPVQVQHLWFEDGRLVHTARLSIGANPTEGYRTYSRQRLRAGRWRVELRTAEGALLHEAAFDVRP
ncbi:MAG: DUF2914 domain-containing protein [Vicinamibacterales bacterium]